MRRVTLWLAVLVALVAPPAFADYNLAPLADEVLYKLLPGGALDPNGPWRCAAYIAPRGEPGRLLSSHEGTRAEITQLSNQLSAGFAPVTGPFAPLQPPIYDNATPLTVPAGWSNLNEPIDAFVTPEEVEAELLRRGLPLIPPP